MSDFVSLTRIKSPSFSTCDFLDTYLALSVETGMLCSLQETVAEIAQAVIVQDVFYRPTVQVVANLKLL